jgi:hypothetical protein
MTTPGLLLDRRGNAGGNLAHAADDLADLGDRSTTYGGVRPLRSNRRSNPVISHPCGWKRAVG